MPAARLAGPQRLDLAARRPDLGARAFGERRDAADVVDVGVGDEDPGGARLRCPASSSRSGVGSSPGSITAASAAPRSARTT